MHSHKKRQKGWRPVESHQLQELYSIWPPQWNKCSYFSKSLENRLFLIAKNLATNVKKVGVQTSVAPGHSAVYEKLSWPTIFDRGPGFWKFNNALLDDELYVKLINDIYPNLRRKCSYIEDKRIFWEMLQMEIPSHTISSGKRKASVSNQRNLRSGIYSLN